MPKSKYPKDLTGYVFNDLTVLSLDHVYKNGDTYWLCQCKCGNTRVVNRYNLTRNKITSCGCQNVQWFKQNEYIETDDCIIGYTNNTHQPFYIDKEDFEKIKDYGWMENDDGYIVANGRHRFKTKFIRIHRLILGIYDKNIIIDYADTCPNNNRKDNLRIATRLQNQMNRKSNKNNKLGVKGVYLSHNKYIASIEIDGQKIIIGVFDNLEDAKCARQNKEHELFGEFAYKE